MAPPEPHLFRSKFTGGPGQDLRPAAINSGLPDTDPQTLLKQLRYSLGELLDGVYLIRTGIPVASPPDKATIKLWLIDPDGMAAPLTERETSAVSANPPYWSFCWGSGLALAQRILAQPEWVAGKTVLDFGCGSGVVAIAAALAGAERVIACDLDPQALAATAVNAFENNVVVEFSDDFNALGEAVDVLFAADVLYDAENIALLQKFCQYAATVIVADSRVKNFDQAGFALIDQVRAVTVPDLGEYEEVKQVRFYKAGEQ